MLVMLQTLPHPEHTHTFTTLVPPQSIPSRQIVKRRFVRVHYRTHTSVGCRYSRTKVLRSPLLQLIATLGANLQIQLEPTPRATPRVSAYQDSHEYPEDEYPEEHQDSCRFVALFARFALPIQTLVRSPSEVGAGDATVISV